jgi:F-type H+-transporting ATPase subunit alpha
MRSFSGTLRLDLAQYRELAAFAQFGSDLDKATQAQLNRGRRLVEVLKQGQYEPLDVALQVGSVFAGVKGFLDDLRVEAVLPFEKTLHRYLSTEKTQLLDEVRKAPKLTKELESALATAVTEAKKMFLAETPAAKAA